MIARAGAACVLLLSCAAQSAQGTNVQNLAARLSALEQSTEADRARVHDRLDELEAARQEAAAPGAPAGAGLAAHDELSAELARVRVQLEEQTRRVEAMGRALAELRADTDVRFAGLRPTAAPAGALAGAAAGAVASTAGKGRKGADAAAATEPVSPVPATLSADQAAIFTLARDQEAKGQRTVAREFYEQYLLKWPTDPSAAEVHFRLGELAFAERRHQDALHEFGAVARDFPASPRVPDALVRTAEALQQLDLRADAEGILAQVVKRYPGSPAAARARTLLSMR